LTLGLLTRNYVIRFSGGDKLFETTANLYFCPKTVCATCNGIWLINFPPTFYFHHKSNVSFSLLSKKMFSSMWQCFVGVASACLHLTALGLEEVSRLVFYTEGLVCEGGEVAGKAAVIDTERDRIAKTAGKLPSGYVNLQIPQLNPLVCNLHSSTRLEFYTPARARCF
jgi:hypothetical protein